MTRLVLTREPEEEGAILGLLDPLGINTIERPWIPSSPGGKPFESCVPAGIYKLESHTRPSGRRVPILINHGLAVFRKPNERINGVGRYYNLIHIANWVHDVVGCIGVGMGRATSQQGPMITKSSDAMELLMNYLINLNWDVELEIVGENSHGIS